MQPKGRRPIKFPGKTDCHPPNGYINWWESCGNNNTNKALEKREVQKQIYEELDQNDFY